jgi:hypothetical protein
VLFTVAGGVVEALVVILPLQFADTTDLRATGCLLVVWGRVAGFPI